MFADLEYWVKEIGNICFGGANVDGVFDSNDSVHALANNEHDDAIRRNPVWSEGAWNGDGDSTVDDLMLAQDDGGYEKGPRTLAVPEPSTLAKMLINVATMLFWRWAWPEPAKMHHAPHHQ